MNRYLELVKTVYEIGQLEADETPQVALAGRSNVGKSSLINCLAGRKKLAKISSKPGKTRSLNYYMVHPEQYFLVDLPGYGYAKTSKSEREKWGKLIDVFIRENKQLKAVAVLLDARLTPQKIDIELVSYLKQVGIPVLPILTKADKCKQKDRARVQKQWADLLQGGAKPLPFSSKTGMNFEKLWESLSQVALD